MFFEDSEFDNKNEKSAYDSMDKLNLDDDKWTVTDGVLHECKIRKADVIEVPDGVEELEILSLSFCNEAEEIRLPKSVKKLNFSSIVVFNLKKLYIENKDIVICSDAMSSSSELKEVYIAGEKQDIVYSKTDADGVAIEKYFKKDTEVVIDDAITEICAQVFEDRSDLTMVALPDSITDIGFMAFANCTGIKEFKMPRNIDKNGGLGSEVFKGWTGEQRIYVPSHLKKLRFLQKWRKGCKAKIIYY